MFSLNYKSVCHFVSDVAKIKYVYVRVVEVTWCSNSNELQFCTKSDCEVDYDKCV